MFLKSQKLLGLVLSLMMVSSFSNLLVNSPRNSTINSEQMLQAGFLSDLLDAIFGNNSGKGNNNTPKNVIVDVIYYPPPDGSGFLQYTADACCHAETVDNDNDGYLDCLDEDPTSPSDDVCGGTMTAINVHIENPPGSGQFFDECKQVLNYRKDGRTALTAFKTMEEWNSFKAKFETPAGGPQGLLRIQDCWCGRKLTYGEMETGLGYRFKQDLFPSAIDGAPPNSEQTTLDKICLDLGCGAVLWVGVRTYSSPGNNTVSAYRNDAWVNIPASQWNEKLGNKTCGFGGAVIECSLPTDPVPSSYKKINCD